MLKRVKGVGGGVNKDLLPAELLPEQWSDCNNVRFRNQFAWKRRGIRQVYSTPTVIPYFLSAYSTSSTRFMVQAGLAKVYAHEGSTETEITRYTDGKTISSITRVGTTATLTTATAHGLSTGNTVTVYGASPSQYNVTGAITVTSTTTFTYTMASDPGGSATLTTASGYSYNVTSNFTGAIDDKWTGGSFNGILVLNHPLDGMYYWAGSTSNRLRRMPAWPAGQKCDAIFFFKNYIFALAPTIDGVKNSQVFLWGSAAEPGALPDSWTAASTNDAGDSPLPAETAGELIDGCTFGDVGFVFDQDACYGVQYIGGNDVFRVFRLPGVDGLLARACVVRIPNGLVYLSNGDVKFFDGASARSIAEGRVRDWLTNSISTNAQRCFLAVNAPYNEVWVCFPEYGDTACTKAAVWNWDSDAWGIFTIPSLTCATSGLVIDGLTDGAWDSDSEAWDSDASTWNQTELSANKQSLIVGKDRAIGMADAATQDFGSSVSWSLERKGLSFGDPDSMKYASGVRLHLDGLAGTTVSVYLGSHDTADADPTYESAATHTQGTTNMVDINTDVGRYVALKLEGSSDQPVALRSYEIDVTDAGRF